MYYPKSQIIENLYTNGGELSPFNSNEDYIGYYFQTSNNEFYSGKNPDDKPNVRLYLHSPGTSPLATLSKGQVNNTQNFKEDNQSEPVGENIYITDTNYYRAKNFTINRGDAPRPPIQSKPQPTLEDYNKGQFKRFFVKKGNEYKFIEISSEEYSKFKSNSPSVQHQLYIPLKVNWRLTGDKESVYNANQVVVSSIERKNKAFGFELSFKGKFDKYWRS